MKPTILILLAGLTMVGPKALGVSRVGGGKIASATDQFVATVPIPFMSRQVDSETVEMDGPIAMGLNFPGPQIMDARTLRIMFPKLQNDTRTEFRKFFERAGWVHAENPNPCIEELLWSKNKTAAAVVSWGQDKGMVVVGPLTAEIQRAILQLVNSIQLKPGACAWQQLK